MSGMIRTLLIEQKAIYEGQIEHLINERDEARREICEGVAAHAPSVNAKQWAQERGWDCFKEDGK
jgi:hypothetical protein